MREEAHSAVAEPVERTERKRRTKKAQKPKRQPRYNVVLWDDQSHTHAYVILMLQQLFGHAPTKGFQLADEVDRRGRAIVLTTTLEHAELKRDQIRAYGKDRLVADSTGSMFASIEPVE